MTMRRISTYVLSIVLGAAATLVVLPTPAVTAAPDQSLVAVTSPMWQTNGRVDVLVHAGGVVYAGGQFTTVRPPGSPAGSNQQARSRFAAFNASTGAVLPLNVSFDGDVLGMALSPDEQILYVVGRFQNVNGQPRGRGAAINLATGALTSWNPGLGDTAWTVDATSTTVYVGGVFGRAKGIVRSRLAALTTSGSLLDWAPQTDGWVKTLRLSPDDRRVFVGGGFSHLSGADMRGLGAVHPVTGNIEPIPNGIIPTYEGQPTSGGCCYSTAVNLTDDGTYMYVAAEGTGGGVFDGSVKFDPSDGSIVWRDGCLGATQAVQPLNGAVYKASHAHNCSTQRGGFAEGQVGPGGHHLLALDKATGDVLHWYPNTNGGTGAGLGPRTLATDGTQLFVGGEFTAVGGVPQQGITRYSTTPQSGSPKQPATPQAAARSTGRVVVTLPATWDPDDATLTYTVRRDGRSGPVIETVERASRPYELPTLRVVDTTLTAGTAASYVVSVTDGDRTLWSAQSNSVVGGSPAANYPGAVQADGATTYWRLGESSGTTAADSSGGGSTGTYAGDPKLGVPGVISDNTAVRLDGVDDGVGGTVQANDPQTFSVEAWVRTTSTSGGKLIGFGNSATGFSSNYDRHVYLTDSGQPIFGVYDGSPRTVRGGTRLNDGQWHHVVATSGGDGMALYVDGALAASDPAVVRAQPYAGYWRVGGDNLGGWPSQPSSGYLAGDVDEVAVYPGELAADEVEQHFKLGGGTVAPPPPTSCPTGEFLASYWNNTTLSGSPALVRCEQAIDHEWGNGSPGPAIADDGFSARWTQTFAAAAGDHTLDTVSDDGIRVSIDGDRYIDAWSDRGPTADSATVTLTAGSHDLVVEYYENGGGATAHFTRTPPAGEPVDTTPPSRPGTVTATAAASGTSVDLSWDAATDDVGVAGYRVFRNGTRLGSGDISATTFSDTTTQPGTTYTYAVRAVDTSGNVGDPSEVTVTTASPPPADQVVHTESWSGADATPWPSVWSTGAKSGVVDVQSDSGRLRLTDTSGAFARASLSGVRAVTDTDLLLSYRWSSSSARSAFNIFVRGAGAWQNGNRPMTGYGLNFLSDSSRVSVMKNVGGTLTTLAGLPGVQPVGTAKRWVRLRVVGDQLKFRTWADGSAEPTTWAWSETDASIAGAGAVYVTHVQQRTTVLERSVLVDDLTLTEVGR